MRRRARESGRTAALAVEEHVAPVRPHPLPDGGNRALGAVLRAAERRHAAAPGLDDLVVRGIQDRRGRGSPLPGAVRGDAEAALGADLGHVRVHTDEPAHGLSEALHARAFTVGGDVFLGRDAGAPTGATARALLGHELVHAVQQGPAPGAPRRVSQPGEPAEREADALGRAVASRSRARAGPTRSGGAALQRWTDLGSWSWDSPFGDRRVVVPVRVGTRQEWSERLARLDNESAYRTYLQGFLEAAADPSSLARTRHPHGFRNYRNDVSRGPKEPEILDFMHALYERGRQLQLPGSRWFFGISGNSVTTQVMRRDLAILIGRYQGQVIAAQAQEGATMPRRGVKEVADQGGWQARRAMLHNAAATAMKGLDLVAAANLEQPPAREVRRNHAFQTIENAAQTIRLVLEVHRDRVARDKAAAQTVFDAVWAAIPGGGALTSAAMSLVKAGFDAMLDEASANDRPDRQSDEMYDAFAARTHQLVTLGQITADDARGTRNSYAAHRR
jgi:hypothetical protein